MEGKGPVLITPALLSPAFVLWAVGIPARLKKYAKDSKKGSHFTFLAIPAKHSIGWLTSARVICRISTVVRNGVLIVTSFLSVCDQGLPRHRSLLVLPRSSCTCRPSATGSRMPPSRLWISCWRSFCSRWCRYGYWVAITVCFVMDRRQGFSIRQTGPRIFGMREDSTG